MEELLGAAPERQPFAPQTESEQAIIDSLIDLTQGQTATRGLGPATEGALAQSIAPTLVGFREAEAQRGLQKRGQDIQGFLELAGLAAPQVIGGQVSKTTGPGIGGKVLTGVAQGLASKKCWVADVLYGPDATTTHLARLYANSHDTFFLKIYGKYGKAWAKWLDIHKWMQPIVKPIWNRMAVKGAKMLKGGL